MVAAPHWQMADGIRLEIRDLLALRARAGDRAKPPPTARRAGTAPSRAAGAGMDLRDIRAYVPGDDLRRLDPSATARTGRLHVRALHEDRDDITLLVADFRRPMLWGTGTTLRSVRAARHLAELGWQATARHGAVGLVGMAAGRVHAVAPAAGEGQMEGLCHLLADWHAEALAAPDGPADLAQALTAARRLAPAGAQVHLATAPGALDGADAVVAQLARDRRLRVALMLDMLELHPPAHPLPVRCGAIAAQVRLAAPDLGAETDRLAALGAVARLEAP